MPKRTKIRMMRNGKPAAVHLNQLCSFRELLQGVIKTSLQLQPRWLTRNHIPLWKSILHNMSTSTSTSLVNESSVQDPDRVLEDGKTKRFVLPDPFNSGISCFCLNCLWFNGGRGEKGGKNVTFHYPSSKTCLYLLPINIVMVV